MAIFEIDRSWFNFKRPEPFLGISTSFESSNLKISPDWLSYNNNFGAKDSGFGLTFTFKF